MARARVKAGSITPPPPTAESRARGVVWLQGLTCGAIVTLVPPTALLAAALLAPAALALWLDRQPGRPVGRAVLVCTLAGAILPLHSLWRGGHSITLALALLADPWTCLPAWAAAGGGWLLAELAPILMRMAMDITAHSRARRLRAQRARLEEEWGIPPAATDDPVSPQTRRSA